MLRFFRSITADEAQQQSAAALKCSAEQQRQASQLQQKAELLKRGPGRPKKLTDAQHVLDMAAAAATSKEDAVEPAEKRGKYSNWFASAYIHDILHAVQRTGSARKAVEWLQRSFPKLPTEAFVPAGEEGKEDEYQAEDESDHEEDEDKDELDVMK